VTLDFLTFPCDAVDLSATHKNLSRSMTPARLKPEERHRELDRAAK